MSPKKQKDPLIHIDYILDSIDILFNYTKNKTLSDFVDSVDMQDKISKRIELIGEAANNVPSAIQKKYPNIPWKNIIGMRNILVHDYFAIDFKLTWKVATKDVKKLKKQILKIKEIIE